MRITVSELKRIIKEEVKLAEKAENDGGTGGNEKMQDVVEKIVKLVQQNKSKMEFNPKDPQELSQFQTSLMNGLMDALGISSSSALNANKGTTKNLAKPQ